MAEERGFWFWFWGSFFCNLLLLAALIACASSWACTIAATQATAGLYQILDPLHHRGTSNFKHFIICNSATRIIHNIVQPSPLSISSFHHSQQGYLALGLTVECRFVHTLVREARYRGRKGAVPRTQRQGSDSSGVTDP